MSKIAVTRIGSALNATSLALSTCTQTRSASTILSQLDTAQLALASSVSETPSTKAFVQVRKSLVALSNAVSSLHQGVHDQDLTLKEFRESLSMVQSKFMDNAAQALHLIQLGAVEVAPTEVSHGKLVVRGQDLKTSLTTVREHLGDLFHKPEEDPDLAEHERSEQAYLSREEKVDAELKQKLARVQALKSTLPLKVVGGFQLLRLPLVPIFETTGKAPTGGKGPMSLPMVRNFSGSAILEKLGIKHLMLNDYVILESQLVVAIDPRKFEHAENSTAVRQKTRKVAVTQMTPIDEALAAINEKSPNHYTLVSDKFIRNPRNTDIIFYWIMLESTFGSLNRNGWSKMKNWGLPW